MDSKGSPAKGRGYDLERILTDNHVTLYITGHEHVFQYHEAKGVHSFVCGATTEHKFYGGEDISQPITWVDRTGSTGFLSLYIYDDLTVQAKFIKGDETHEVLFEKTIPHQPRQ